MFHVLFLDKLSRQDSHDAVTKPITLANSPVRFDEASLDSIYEITRGYPYFIQYVCREVFDVWSQQIEDEDSLHAIPVEEIMRKLDSDFFAGRWARATDRQRDLLLIVAQLENCNSEFTVQEVVSQSRSSDRPFSSSHVNQMFSALADAGLIYKNRWGKYSFAVPLLDQFIKRQAAAR
jgi:hypothetical protein